MNTTKNNTKFDQTVEIPAPLEIHPSVSDKAANLLLRVIEVILVEPRSYNQGTGCVWAECGSACCLFGHMHILQEGRPAKWMKAVFSCHAERFGLTQEQGIRLYDSTKWPAPWKQNSDTNRVAPEIGIARVEHFLRTGQ